MLGPFAEPTRSFSTVRISANYQIVFLVLHDSYIWTEWTSLQVFYSSGANLNIKCQLFSTKNNKRANFYLFRSASDQKFREHILIQYLL